jgi:hypothetical protein
MPFIDKSVEGSSALASERCTWSWLISPFNRDDDSITVVYPNA